MSKIKTAVHDLNMLNSRCPNCGTAFSEVTYYTAVPDPAKAGVYQGLSKRTGGFCRVCDKERKRKRIPFMAGVAVLGVISLIFGILILTGAFVPAVNNPDDLGMVLMVEGIGVILVMAFLAIVILVEKPTSEINNIKLYFTFLGALNRQKERDLKLTYFSPQQAGNLYRRF